MSSCHESGHVPVGQLEEEAFPDLAANVENIFSVSFEPHFSQVCGMRPSVAFSRNDVTCPHLLHWYSKIGIAHLL